MGNQQGEGRPAMAYSQPLTSLKPDPRNANKGTERGRNLLEDSLRKYGAGRSIVVDKHGVVIGGNKTLEVAADIGLADAVVVPTDGRQLVVVQRTDLDLEADPRAAELAIADNRVAEVSLHWDGDVLKDLVATGADLGRMFTERELASITGLVAPEEPAEPATFDAEGQCDSQPGQTYELGPHWLTVGDSTNPTAVAEALRGEAPVLWLFDPPFDEDYRRWALLESVQTVVVWGRSKGSLLWQADVFRDAAWTMHELIFVGEWPLGWANETLPSLMHQRVMVWRQRWWADEHEALDLEVYRTCGAHTVQKWDSREAPSQWGIGRGRPRRVSSGRPRSWQEGIGHPSSGVEDMAWGKPLMQAQMMMGYVPADALVWDSCAGSGSTLIAAAQHKRRWAGMEIEPRWADVIRRRWTAFAREHGLTVGSGGLDPSPALPKGALRPSALRAKRAAGHPVG